MKIKKIMSGVFAAALLLMGGQTAFCVQGSSPLSNVDSGVIADLTSYSVPDKVTAVGNTKTAAAVSNAAVASPTVGAPSAVVNSTGARIDDRLSTMMAIYQQRKEHIAQKSMTQPVGPAGSGAQVRIDKLQKAWGRYTSTWGDQNSIDGNSGYEFVSHGPVFGYDKFINDRFLVGGLFGYSRTDAEADTGGEVDVNSYLLGVYGSYLFSDVDYLNFVFSYARSNIDSSSSLTTGTLSGDTDANGWVFAGEYGHKFLLKNTFIVTPVVGFVLSLADVEGYTAKGSTAAVLDETYADSRSKFFSSKIGIKGDWLFRPTGTLKAKALWLHEYSTDIQSTTTVNYQGSTSLRTLKGLDPGRDKGQFGLGLKYGFMNGIVLDIDADFTVGEEYEAWTTSGKIEYPF